MYGVPGMAISDLGQGGIPAVPFEQPKNLFRYGEQSLWSSQRHAAANTIANGTFRLFTTPLGQVGQGFATGLTIAETSLKEGGRIPAGVAFDAYGVSCLVATGLTAQTVLTLATPVNTVETITDLINVQNNGVLSWDFVQTAVDIAPLHLIGAGGGAFGAISTTANNVSVGQLNNGAGSIWMYRKHPISLPGNSTFSILLRYGANAAAIGATNDVVLKVALFGYYKTAIEIG
ncbi:MAG: hypothetical protein ACO3NL_12285 [Phycisphaerales bacterium]